MCIFFEVGVVVGCCCCFFLLDCGEDGDFSGGNRERGVLFVGIVLGDNFEFLLGFHFLFFWCQTYRVVLYLIFRIVIRTAH